MTLVNGLYAPACQFLPPLRLGQMKRDCPDAVNTASRLCSIAKQGEIILSESTMRRVADHVDAVTMAPVRLKGKENEQQVYNVVGMKGDEWRQERTRPM